MPIRVVLADDHPIVLDGLEQVFRLESDFEVVARCRDGDETVAAVRKHQPDILVLDLRMRGMNGLDVLRALKAPPPSSTRVVLLTAGLDDEQLLDAIRLGVQGIVLKETAAETLLEAVRQVHAGGSWLEQGLGERALRRLLQPAPDTSDSAELTAPELDIVRLVADGMRNRDVAQKLSMSEGMVKVHLHKIYKKLGATNRLELIVHARDKGLL